MNFHVGQKVVCVDASPGRLNWGSGHWKLVKGAIYTVTGKEFFDGVAAVSILECNHAPGQYLRASRFRPVVERKTDISIFTAMLDGAKDRVRA